MRAKLLCCCIFISLVASGQDINFSQFYELPLLRNPALAGFFKGDFRATSAFRNQWGTITTPYRTSALGTELRISMGASSNDYVIAGLQITDDRSGDSRMGKTQVLPVITYHKSLSDKKDTYISAGFIGGAVQQRFDASKLSFDDQFVGGAYSPTNPTQQTFSNTNVTYWDAAAGVSFSNVAGLDIRYYVGAAYFHFNQPKVAFSRSNDIRLNKKFVVNAGVSLPSSETDRIIFYADYFMQGGHNQGQSGVLYNHDIFQDGTDQTFGFSAGAFYRWNDAIIPVLKLEYYKWTAGITYDINASKLTKASSGMGGLEFSLTFKSFMNIRNSSIEKMHCPVDIY